MSLGGLCGPLKLTSLDGVFIVGGRPRPWRSVKKVYAKVGSAFSNQTGLGLSTERSEDQRESIGFRILHKMELSGF